MDNFDPYNVFLAFATNIPQRLKTGFVLQSHILILSLAYCSIVFTDIFFVRVYVSLHNVTGISPTELLPVSRNTHTIFGIWNWQIMFTIVTICYYIYYMFTTALALKKKKVQIWDFALSYLKQF